MRMATLSLAHKRKPASRVRKNCRRQLSVQQRGARLSLIKLHLRWPRSRHSGRPRQQAGPTAYPTASASASR